MRQSRFVFTFALFSTHRPRGEQPSVPYQQPPPALLWAKGSFACNCEWDLVELWQWFELD